jgi:hypothetical protein
LFNRCRPLKTLEAVNVTNTKPHLGLGLKPGA